MTITLPDRRNHAFDPDVHVAEEALRGQLPEGQWRYVAPRPMWAAQRLSLRSGPDVRGSQVTEALAGSRCNCCGKTPRAGPMSAPCTTGTWDGPG
ncbi:hypothetical protein ACFSC4_03935 [Deinococcus malanensis]|uniref:hypothetical protein n=1 Tax=Deinococcus malanensis TaxID=1706855 RepID=UPI00362D1B4A